MPDPVLPLTRKSRRSRRPAPAVPTNYKYQVFYDSDEYFHHLIKAIDEAQHEVIVEVYIFSMDHVGRRVLNALAAASARKVSVRLFIDGIGSLFSVGEIREFCLRKHIDLHVYNPLSFFRRAGRTGGEPSKWKWGFKKFLGRLNKRNHRKLAIVDRRIVFLGSCNITDVHSRRYSGTQAWRDTEIRIEAPERDADIETLAQIVLHSNRSMTQKLINPPRPFRFHTELFRLNWSRKIRRRLFHDLITRIKRARERIYITNAYFVPRRALLRSLGRAGIRGVPTVLCLPERTDVWFVRWAGHHVFNYLLKRKVRIFEYQPSVLHAKTAVLDDVVLIGSHNLNHRSFLHDQESEALLQDEGVRHSVLQQWDRDLARSREITLEELRKTFFLKKWVSQIFFWLRYWL